MRPDTLSGLIGQEDLKRKLTFDLEVMTAEFDRQFSEQLGDDGLVDVSDLDAVNRASGIADGCFKGKQYLISGRSGMGKSTLAKAFATDISAIAAVRKWPKFSLNPAAASMLRDPIDVNEWTEQGPPTKFYRYAYVEGAELRSAAQLDPYLHYVQPMGVLFIDEAHGMSSEAQDGLLEVLESGQWRSDIRGGLSGHQSWVLMMATNYEHKLRAALRNGRLTRIVMSSYTEEEQAEMATRVADKCDFTMPSWMVDEVVHRCGGIPRRIVTATIDIAGYFKLHPDYTREQVIDFMIVNGLYPLGVDPRGLDVLRVLCGNDGRKMSTADLVGAAGLTRDVYEDEIRPSLVNGGDMLIEVRGGVRITKLGRELLAEVDC